MKVDVLEAFLKEAGYAYVKEATEAYTVFTFQDRGLQLFAFADDDDEMLLALRSRVYLEGYPGGQALLEKTVREIEDESYVLKLLASPPSEKTPYVEVIAEQYQGNLDSVKAVFWRTVDQIRATGNHVISRLHEQLPDADTTPIAASIEAIEAAIKLGCQIQHDASVTIEKLRDSLALTRTESATASAFCVASTKKESFFVTNAHVVKDYPSITLYRQHPEYQKLNGTVIARGDASSVDLAIVSVPVGGIPSVSISELPPAVDLPIAIAGYARVQLYAAKHLGELYAGVHFGTVTCVKNDGTCVLHDATSREGNSGGPLFDPTTGAVYGVESFGWEDDEESGAVGPSAMHAFFNACEPLKKALKAAVPTAAKG